MASLASSLLSFFFPTTAEAEIGSSEDSPLRTVAVPGLTTLLDVALYNSFEGELTATVTSSHNLLAAFIDLKKQAIVVLHCLLSDTSEHVNRLTLLDSFARSCLEIASDVIERLTTDQFAHSANGTDPYKSLDESTALNSQNQLSSNKASSSNTDKFATAVQDSAFDTGRRIPLRQRGKDCWESPRLYCPDYVNFDDAALLCQRKLRSLLHHGFVASNSSHVANGSVFGVSVGGNSATTTSAMFFPISAEGEREATVLLQVLCHDIPARLIQFRASIEADSEVMKRLYLIKNEYRAPFRAFMEAHLSLQRAPSLELAEEYLKTNSQSQTKIAEQRRAAAKNKLQKLMETSVLVEILALERQIEEIEIDIAKQLYPFSELARFLDYKRARVRQVPSVVAEAELPFVQELLHRLKNVLSRSTNAESGSNQFRAECSTGIRPILLDLQGVPRDGILQPGNVANEEMDGDSRLVESLLDRFLSHLETLGKLCLNRNTFRVEKRNSSAGDTLDNIPAAIVRGCAEEFDSELFRCQVEDWCSMIQKQHSGAKSSRPSLDSLSESIRRAEMHVSLASANAQSLEVVLKRLQQMASDRAKRFDVLKEIVEDVCVREMNLYVKLSSPDPKMVLELKPTSSVGFFGVPLQIAGEKLPLG